jgi:dihydroflavonol-4-reductase
VARLGAVTGRRRLRAVTVPAGLLLPVGRVVQLVQRVTPVHIPVEFEAVYFEQGHITRRQAGHLASG